MSSQILVREGRTGIPRNGILIMALYSLFSFSFGDCSRSSISRRVRYLGPWEMSKSAHLTRSIHQADRVARVHHLHSVAYLAVQLDAPCTLDSLPLSAYHGPTAVRRPIRRPRLRHPSRTLAHHPSSSPILSCVTDPVLT